MAYGSPAVPGDVRPYLEDVRGGRPVSDEAVEELAERYRRIGGRSPLDDVTEAQRAALERELGVPVFVGMKHWHPRIAEAVESALAGGATRIVGLVLAPHYSRLSIGEYREQLLETSRLVAERAGLERWSFAFQSASATGEPWLGPDVLEELDRLHEAGVEKVLVAPIGFVSDHLEILWDLDIEARERAAELGLELERIESLNDDPAFVRALAELVEERLAVSGKSRS